MLTPYQIAEIADQYVGTFNRTAINRLFRKQDDSHLWPINGRFNATDRAIRRLQDRQRDGLCLDDGLEYALALDAEISSIVNGDI
jgi:hypothetical protein